VSFFKIAFAKQHVVRFDTIGWNRANVEKREIVDFKSVTIESAANPRKTVWAQSQASDGTEARQKHAIVDSKLMIAGSAAKLRRQCFRSFISHEQSHQPTWQISWKIFRYARVSIIA
jgi:hypothetical protein